MTNKIKNKRLAFLFTKGMSLKKWDEAGILSREVELYNNLAKNFKRIYFFTYGGKDELEYTKFLESNIDIIYKKSKVSDNFYSFLLPFINKDIIKRCSLIKTNQMKGTVSAIIVKLVNWKIKLVVRTGYSQSFTSKKEKRIFEYLKYTVLEFFAYILCDLGIVSSIGIKEYILRKYKISSKKIFVIPNMINTDFFKPLENVKKYQDKVLFVGRLSREKNLSTLFEALKGTGLSLDIVGRGDMKKFLMKKAEQLNLHVNFLGIIENSKMPDVYNRYYVYILPSFYEGLPKTLLEAMGSGLACIGTNVYGIKEIIINNVNGFLVGLNKKSINKAIMELTDNKELCLELGRRARQDVLDNYSFDSLIKVEVNLYEKLF